MQASLSPKPAWLTLIAIVRLSNVIKDVSSISAAIATLRTIKVYCQCHRLRD